MFISLNLITKPYFNEQRNQPVFLWVQVYKVYSLGISDAVRENVWPNGHGLEEDTEWPGPINTNLVSLSAAALSCIFDEVYNAENIEY